MVSVHDIEIRTIPSNPPLEGEGLSLTSICYAPRSIGFSASAIQPLHEGA